MSNDIDSLDKCLSNLDARKMCFEQGKTCVYMGKNPDIIIMEEPNGVVERFKRSTKMIERTWPDGRVEHFRKGDPRDLEYPYIPPQE